MVNKKTFILYPFFSFIGILVICLYNPIFDYITLAQILGWILFLEGVRFLEIKKREKKWEEDQEELLHLMEDIDGDVEEYKLHYHYLGPLRDEIQKYLVEKREGKKESERQKSTIKINMENMAHQIKTSITGSLLLLDLMEIEDRKEYREKLKVSMDRLADLSDGILKLSSLEGRTNPMVCKKVFLPSLVSDTELYLEPLFKEKNISFKVEGEDIYLYGDRYWLEEAIINVIKNAIDHTEVGKEILISWEENEIYQNISIENQGYMIPREKQNKIFERFYKLDPKSKGFGIGLPMAKVIMEEHGGKIFVESDEDKTTFHLRFYK